jgi:hypothetical protein
LNGKLDYTVEPAARSKMDCMATPPRTNPAPEYRQADHIEDLIDEAGAESFPASDPPSVTPRRKPKPRSPEARDRVADKSEPDPHSRG